MLRTVAALGLTCLLLTGCIIPDAVKRKEITDENEKERDLLEVRTVRDVADFGNIGPVKVDGIGLVTGLNGTGHSPDGFYRKHMEQYLLKNIGNRGGHMAHVPKEETVQQILDNPNNCLVIVSALIPAGARKGDRFDVDVTLPAGSKATSLAGGYLQLSLLRVWESPSNLSNNPMYKDAVNPNLPGHVFGQAKGQLVVGFGANSDPNELKRARVWQGGESRINRPYALMMRNDHQSVKIANDVAQRVNILYQEDPRSKRLQADFTDQEKRILTEGVVANQLNKRNDPTGLSQQEMAKAASKEIINIRVPFAYRFDHERFLHVAGFTPLNDNDPRLLNYKQRLQKMLEDPRDTWRAARRLEALGRDSIPILKTGLESKHPFVRFTSAEALAYLGSTAGVEELTRLAQQEPNFVKPCTIALANLGESICRDRLAELFASEEPTVRCAAFHALASMDESDARLGGQFLNDSFWLYRVPQAPGSMVYYSISKRPQVVLFGRNIALNPGTRMMVGKDFTIAADDKSGQFQVKRFVGQVEEKRICSNRLDDVLTALSGLGASYPDIVEFLRKTNDYRGVNCPIGHWTTPEVRLETLIETGRQMKETASR